MFGLGCQGLDKYGYKQLLVLDDDLVVVGNLAPLLLHPMPKNAHIGAVRVLRPKKLPAGNELFGIYRKDGVGSALDPLHRY